MAVRSERKAHRRVDDEKYEISLLRTRSGVGYRPTLIQRKKNDKTNTANMPQKPLI